MNVWEEIPGIKVCSEFQEWGLGKYYYSLYPPRARHMNSQQFDFTCDGARPQHSRGKMNRTSPPYVFLNSFTRICGGRELGEGERQSSITRTTAKHTEGWIRGKASWYKANWKHGTWNLGIYSGHEPDSNHGMKDCSHIDTRLHDGGIDSYLVRILDSAE